MEEEKETFGQQLLAALDERKAWYDTNVLPKMQENYRLHHSCVSNLIGVFEKKSLVNPDPYKHDKKISEIVAPEDTDFSESERAIVLGTRISDYESMLDFICNYFKFSVDHITLDQIRRLGELNNTFQWSNLSFNSPKANTRGLVAVISAARTGADPLTMSLINDSIAKSVRALQDITTDLRAIAKFQRELYKGEIRRAIFQNPQFNKQKAENSPTDMQLEIKKLFPVVMGKRPYYSDLVDEIVMEEIGPNKDARRAKLLSSLHVVKKIEQKQERVVDTKEILMEAVRILGTTCEQYMQMLQKIKENHNILEGEHNTLADKLLRLFRKSFGMADPPVDYEIVIVDRSTETQKRERIHYNQFVSDLEKRAKYYESFSVRKTPGYNRIAVLKEEAIMEFLNKHLIESNALMVRLTSLDEFFKEAADVNDRPRIKGIKMELTTLKNTLVKTNQRRAEYAAYVEEQTQMRKLGIIS